MIDVFNVYIPLVLQLGVILTIVLGSLVNNNNNRNNTTS